MNSEKFKQAYSLILLLITVSWAGFSVAFTYRALAEKLTTDILATAGASVLLGVLLKMLGDINTFWFRKAGPRASNTPSTAGGPTP